LKKHFIISSIVVGIALFLSLLSVFSGSHYGFDDAAMAFGVSCCAGGLICLFIAAVLGIAGNKDWGKSMLIGGGITFLIGTGTCSVAVFHGLH
jgi:hypothetical protein